MTRELSDQAAKDQALALDAYSRKGGSTSRWLDSKGFGLADRRAILLALSEL